jgi:hypothetical protein
MTESNCERCGASLNGSDRFCRTCGYAQPIQVAGAADESLDFKLQQAMDGARRALDEAAAGKLGDEQLQSQLFRVGLVVQGDFAYLLDLEHGGWSLYNGVDVHTIKAP